ncbi:MAG TPA: hypothetical protein VIV60_37650, partial [Polyangiaceae bacterium]
LCRNGACANPSNSLAGQGGTGNVVAATGVAPYDGMGVGWRPLTPGCGPGTAKQCGGSCEQQADPNGKVLRSPASFCFGADPSKSVVDPTPEDPAAMIEQVIESQNGVSYVHIRVTFDPAFVDNTYGANAHSGWFASANGKAGKGHTFNGDLTGSDHIELLLTDASGATVMSFGEDYISSLSGDGGPKPPPGDKPGPGAGPGQVSATGGATSATSATSAAGTSSDAACGYTNLGVTGGDGKMMLGDASNVLAVASSIDRNLNGCGYCQSSACVASGGAGGASSGGDCTVNSPLTDDKYTPNPATPNWNYAVVYEIWVKLGAFDSGGGFGQAYITFVHASPSKIPGDNTLYVVPTPCPPEWTSCPVGQTCVPNGAGGSSGAAGAGNVPVCPPNYEISITLEDNRSCVPIPFAGWPNMAPCPDGYALKVDVTDESQRCVQK